MTKYIVKNGMLVPYEKPKPIPVIQRRIYYQECYDREDLNKFLDLLDDEEVQLLSIIPFRTDHFFCKRGYSISYLHTERIDMEEKT